MSWDTFGDLYVADGSNNRIRRIDGNGIISTVAGSGAAGYSGDGGAATAAALNGPYGLAVDGNGDLFFADHFNHVVRRVDGRSGVITTLAGNGVSGFAGDGGPATSASLYYPGGVALLPDGSVLIADTGNKRIRKVTNGIITTVAGDANPAGGLGDGQVATNAFLANPADVITDSRGNYYIADQGSCLIRRVDASTQIISTYAGGGSGGAACSYTGDGGLATAATLNGPGRLALDPNGNLYIAEMFVARIRKVATSGIITTIAGSTTVGSGGDGGPASRATFTAFGGLVTDSLGTLYIADSGVNRVRHIDSAGLIWSVVGGSNGDGYPAEVATVSPEGMDWDSLRNLFIADGVGNRIRRIDAVSGMASTVAGTGTAGYAGNGGLATAALLNSPAGLVVDTAGNIYFADYNNQVVRRIDAVTTVITTVAGNNVAGFNGDGTATQCNLYFPDGLGLLPDGSVLIADSGNKLIRKLTPSGRLITVAGGGSPYAGTGDGQVATTAYLNYPVAVTADSAGNFYIADQSACRIRRVDAATQIITTVAGGGTVAGTTCGYNGDNVLATTTTLNGPNSVVLDASGNLFIGEGRAPRVRAVDAVTGLITTVAGYGRIGYSGDGGPGTSAMMSHVSAVGTSPNGPLYIGDSGNTNIREVVLSSIGIAGRIYYYGNPSRAVGGATVQLTGTSTGGTPTDTTGQFNFSSLTAGNWKIQPQKIGGAGGAIDINDAISILNVSSGLQSVTAPQQLACDVNGDGLVDIRDAVLILQYTVGLITRFPVAQACNSDWVFVPQPTTVANEQIIQPRIVGSCQPGALSFQPLSGQANNQNFAAVLFGDCNGSWQPGSFAAAPLISGLSARSQLHLAPHARRRGNHLEIPVSVDTTEGFRAFSAHVRYDTAQLTPVGVHAIGAARRSMILANARVPGSLRIALAADQPLPGGAVVVLEFEAAAGDAGAATLRIQSSTVKP